MDKRTARRLAAATAITVPGALGVAGMAHAGATFLTPRANTAVGGKSVTIYAQFTAPRPVASVKLFLDDSLLGERAFKPGGTSGSVNFAWDSTAVGGGTHHVSLKMFDRSGRLVGTQAIPISVVNGGGADTVPPQVTILAPAPNAALHGTFDVKVLATDNSGEAPYVSLFIDKELRSVSNRQPYSVTVDTSQYANGNHVLEAWAFDAASNKGTATPVSIRVNNPGGATTLNTDVNSAAPAPAAEAPHPTAEPVLAVAEPKAPEATKPVAVVPVLRPAKVVRPAAGKPAITAKPKVQVAAKPVAIARPKALAAAAPKIPVQNVLEAAPALPEAPAIDSASIRELPVEAPAPKALAPVPEPVVNAPEPKIAAVEPAPKPVAKALPKTAVPRQVSKAVAPRPALKLDSAHSATKLAAAKLQPASVEEAAPVYVLKMKGDKVLEQSPVVKSAKVRVAKALPAETGNLSPLPKHIAAMPRTTAAVVKAHSNPAPLKVAVAAKPVHRDLTPVIVPRLPSDRVNNGRILHAVRPGETPERVAHSYGVPVKRLLASNQLGRKARFTVGQMVAVPSPVRLAFNDSPIQFDVAPRIQNGVTTAALRQICEAAGGQVDWNARTKEVRVSADGAEIVLRIGSKFATVNGERVSLDVAAGLYGGRALVPVRFLTDALKLHAEYDLRSGEISLHHR